MVWEPRGLIGPGFGLPWPAGGQVGWPSRWDHFSGPGGRTAGRFPFPRVRFQRWPCWGPKSSRWVPGTVLVPSYWAGSARKNGRKKWEATDLQTVVPITEVASSRRTKQAICWSWTAASGGVMDAQHLGDLEGLQSAFASTKMGLQRPAADLVVSRSTGSDARCRLVVHIAAGKQVALVGCAAGTKSQVRARATGPIRPHSLVVSSYFAGSLVERANAALSAHPAPLRTSFVSPLGHIMSWFTFLLSLSEFCALYRSYQLRFCMVSR